MWREIFWESCKFTRINQTMLRKEFSLFHLWAVRSYFNTQGLLLLVGYFSFSLSSPLPPSSLFLPSCQRRNQQPGAKSFKPGSEVCSNRKHQIQNKTKANKTIKTKDNKSKLTLSGLWAVSLTLLNRNHWKIWNREVTLWDMDFKLSALGMASIQRW